MRRLVRRAGRALRDFAIGRDEPAITAQIMRRDARSTTFLSAIDYINYEAIPGDVIEFGVFTGLSLAQLAHGHGFDPKGMERRFVGFDSFIGLPPATEGHARWATADCAVNHSWHPRLPIGAPVTADVTRDLFAACGLAAPELHVGAFADTVSRVVPSRYPAIALVHLDCDLFESTREALERSATALQDGSMLMFDDWFHYRGDPRKGQSRAFAEFLDRHPEWLATSYRTYATFCHAFILSRR
jgi:predicted O-methyltransferase YrrM